MAKVGTIESRQAAAATALSEGSNLASMPVWEVHAQLIQIVLYATGVGESLEAARVITRNRYSCMPDVLGMIEGTREASIVGPTPEAVAVARRQAQQRRLQTRR